MTKKKSFGSSVNVVSWNSVSAITDHEFVRKKMIEIEQTETGICRIYKPKKTAAFSTKDSTNPNFKQAKKIAYDAGFEPVIRPTGGHLAVFDENSLIIDIVAPHSCLGDNILDRYRLFAEKISNSLYSLGVDSRIGPVLNEFCEGRFSINACGKKKLVGIAQKISKKTFNLSALFLVTPSIEALDILSKTYKVLGLSFNPLSHGCLEEFVINSDYINWEKYLLEQVLDLFDNKISVKVA